MLRLRAPGRPKVVDQLRERIEAMVAAGVIPQVDQREAGAFVWSAAHGLAILLLDRALDSVRAKDETDAETTDRVLHRILRGLGAAT